MVSGRVMYEELYPSNFCLTKLELVRKNEDTWYRELGHYDVKKSVTNANNPKIVIRLQGVVI